MPIIINGGSGCAGGWWSKHLENEEKNDRAELIEIGGLTAETVADAFREMQGLAAGTRCKNYFYQANINPREDEHLTPVQWREAVDRLEKNLGLAGQPRFVIEHEKKGRTHRHVVWSRIDPDRMVAISDSLTAAIHERTSRELEIRFDLERGRSILTRDRESDRPDRRPDKSETFRAGETGIDPQAMKAEISALRRSADNGQSFKAALEASGDYVLARGDRRDFVVVDRASDEHSLARRVDMKAAALRQFMKEIDPAHLPSVAEAKAQQHARHDQRDAVRQAEPPAQTYDRDADNAAWMDAVVAAAIAKEEADHAAEETRQRPATAKEVEHGAATARGPYATLQTPQPAAEVKPARAGTAAKIRTAWRESYDANPTTDAVQLAEAFEARGIGLAQVTPEEAYASERRAAFAKAVGKSIAPWREGEIVAVDGRGSVYRLNERTTGDDRAVIEGRLAGLDPGDLVSVTAAKEVARATSRAAWQQQKETERAEARRDAPVSGTAAHIRMAWQTGRTQSEFKEALAAHSIGLAHVTAADAEASRVQAELYRERMQTKDATARGPYVSMKTPEPGRYAPQLAEGEIVAVDGHGSVYRLDERTTGSLRPDIEGRLAGIDRAALMNVTAAREAMQAAGLAAWVAERQAEREKTRPATALEGRIIECAEQARLFGAYVQKDEHGTILRGADAVAYRLRPEEERTGGEGAIVHGPAAFAARLDAAGIAIVRVTEADVPALDALRQGEAMARFAAETNNEARPQHHFAKLEIGELAAVTRGGDVHRISADKLRGVEIPADLPSVTEARAASEIDRERTDALYGGHRAEIAADREAFAAEREERAAAAHTARDVRDTVRGFEAAVDAGPQHDPQGSRCDRQGVRNRIQFRIRLGHGRAEAHAAAGTPEGAGARQRRGHPRARRCRRDAGEQKRNSTTACTRRKPASRNRI